MNERWWKTFRAEPEQAVADLFSGRAGSGSALRLDVPELLYQAFAPHGAVEDRASLDDALYRWLDHMRQDHANEVRSLGADVYGKRVGDALIAAQLLDLPVTRERIRTDVDAWEQWLAPLRLAPERDPALECWRLMTRGQEDTRHTDVWLRLAECPRQEYLTVALAGLTRLPNDGDAGTNQQLAMRALLRHAVANHHDVKRARRLIDGHLAALQRVFPRAPMYWNETLHAALDAEPTGQPDLDRALRQGMPLRDRSPDRARTPTAQSEIKAKRPKRLPAIKERMTKAAMVQEMAQRTELSKGQIESVLSELESIIERHVRSRGAGEFVLPGLFKISRAKTKAQKKTGRNPATGERIVIPAKPAQTIIRMRPLKRLRDMA